MRVGLATLEGPRVLQVTRYEDARGFFSETWSRARFRDFGIYENFVQDNHSVSRMAGTLRGLHFQAPPHAQAKLVWVTRGAVYDIVVDLRLGSRTYGCWSGIELSARQWNQLFVPTGFAHGFCTLEPDTHVAYKVSAPYCREAEGGVRWNDPEVGITWPRIAGGYVITPRDRSWPALSELETPFLHEMEKAGRTA